MHELANLHPAAALSLAKWHEMVAKADMSDLRSIVHPEATVRSPATFSPYKGADVVVLALSTVMPLFSDLVYQRQAVTTDGFSAILEFSAKIGGKELKGADLIRFHADGRILDFEVLVRPLNALQVVSEEMGKRVGDRLPAYKVKV